jgi:N-acetylmuramoyl-L-alanine amidase
LLGSIFALSTALGVPVPYLAPLAPPLDWSAFNAYQKTITRKEFTRLVNRIYSIDGAFWDYTTINDDQVTIFSDLKKAHAMFTLHFADSDSTEAPLPYSYKTKADSTDPARPLKGIRIALDPGHVGGDWAKLEARYFKLGDDPPVEEAKLNMITCRALADRLQADGATIIWAKHDYTPMTDLRPESLMDEARAWTKQLGKPPIEKAIEERAALLFYRVAEIRARADIVNAQHPDLTICVHYNADDWGNPDSPTLSKYHSRLIIFVNGSYEKPELVYDDVKYDMMRKVLDRDGPQEERGCALVGQSMLDQFKYMPDMMKAPAAHRLTDVPSVFARDLLANRLYHGPVIYCEGPYMNAPDAYYRIIAGDYLGTRTIKGESYQSIYRDYAISVERGVLKYFGVK